MLLFVYFGRQGAAPEEVTHAAAVAARAASMERDAGAAQAAAPRGGEPHAGRGRHGLRRRAERRRVGDASGRRAVSSTVTVTCQRQGVAEIGAPSRTLSASARATIDHFVLYGG